MSYGESQGEKRCPMGRVRERKGVLWGESGREKVSYGESQGEKRCHTGSAKREKMCKVCGLCFVLFLKIGQPP